MATCKRTKAAFTMRCDDPLKLISSACVIGGPEPIACEAKWDTGATVTCISHELAETIGVEPDYTYAIGTSNGQSIENGYKLGLVLPNGMEVSPVDMIESDIHRLGFDMLIGMDVITRGDLAVSSKGSSTQFTFRMPSLEEADFCDG
jgi:hypothetical protein